MSENDDVEEEEVEDEGEEEDCPVEEDVCTARMATLGERIRSLDSKVTYLFGTSLLLIGLEIANLALRGH